MHLGTVTNCITAFGVVLQRYTMFALFPGLRRPGAHLGTVIDCIMAFCVVLQRCSYYVWRKAGALGRPRGTSEYRD